VGSAAGLVWLRIWRARRRRTILSRAHRLREAAARNGRLCQIEVTRPRGRGGGGSSRPCRGRPRPGGT
jgi:hypothetical protein